MNSKQKKIWHNIYEAAISIAEFEPWNTISEKDVFCYVTEDEKNMYFFKIMGQTTECCGIVCYTHPVDFLNAHHFDIYGNPKNEPALYMQNAIIGFWDDKKNVSKKNIKILDELGLKCKGKGSWLHFEKYRERLFPEDLSDKDAEILIDALGNLYMMLKAVFVDNMQIDFENGDALLRRYAGNGIWHNIPIDWKSFSKELSLQATVGNKSILQSIKKIPIQNLSLEVDARCLPEPLYDEENNVDFFPMIYTVIDANNGFVFETNMVEYNRNTANEILTCISDICYQIGRPKKIFVNDNRIYNMLNYFCKQTGIKLEFTQKSLKQTEDALKSLFEYLEKDGAYSFCNDDICFNEEDDDVIDLSKYDDEYWESDSYVISVSLFTGCYRHIIISGASTLEDLHEAILDAFDFDDDHAHVFFMNNKKWTPGGYYSKYVEDENKFTCNYKIKEVLKDKQQFVYVFDLGAEWTFSCKVLRIENEPTIEASVIRSKGEAPFQYSYDYDEDYDDDIFDIDSDSDYIS